MPSLLTIAGFDPSSGAGITADLAVFGAHGVYGTSCITALTVQSTVGVAAVYPMEPLVVRETLAYLDTDLPPDGVKIGMLGTSECAEAVADYLEGLHAVGRRPIVVLDPVMLSSSGRELLDGRGQELLRERVLPQVDWVTPNLEELAALSGRARAPAPTRDAILEAASALSVGYRKLTLLVTGGDLDPPDDLLLLPAESSGPGGQPEHFWLAGKRVVTTSTHGTGCALSSALLCRLVFGDVPLHAAVSAKGYVVEALRQAATIGHGRGPMNLLWPLAKPNSSYLIRR